MTNFLLLCYNKIPCLSLYSYQKIMDLKVTIKNLGKLIDADIRINKFTVFAGLNNTGKSSASKMLYSRLNASMEAINNFYIYDDANELRKCVEHLKNEGIMDNENFSLFLQNLDNLDKIVAKISSDISQFSKISILEENMPAILAACKSVGDIGADIADKINTGMLEHKNATSVELFKDSCDILKYMDESTIIMHFKMRIFSLFVHNLLQNFQVQELSDLKNDKGNSINIKIGEETLVLGDRGRKFHPASNMLDMLIADKALYLGSPLFWQLKNPLESVGNKKRHQDGKQRLSGVPEYFYDMVDTLREQYTKEPPVVMEQNTISEEIEGDTLTNEPSIFSKVADRLTGEHGINGKVSVAATGEMLYAEKDGATVPLVQAAMGIVNMGVLALLIEKNILDENTFLFIDEPEAHLHPEWQVEMADALFKLAEAGVNVVVATHSDNILKWLEVHVNKNPKAKEIIALNHFSKEGVESIDTDRFDTGLAEIKIKLTDPFARLHWEGLRHDVAR